MLKIIRIRRVSILIHKNIRICVIIPYYIVDYYTNTIIETF